MQPIQLTEGSVHVQGFATAAHLLEHIDARSTAPIAVIVGAEMEIEPPVRGGLVLIDGMPNDQAQRAIAAEWSRCSVVICADPEGLSEELMVSRAVVLTSRDDMRREVHDDRPMSSVAAQAGNVLMGILANTE